MTPHTKWGNGRSALGMVVVFDTVSEMYSVPPPRVPLLHLTERRMAVYERGRRLFARPGTSTTTTDLPPPLRKLQ